jgi:hypothetical protein
VEQEQGEDCDGEAKVVLQESRVPDIGDQAEEHADCGDDPSEPAFVEEGCVKILDLQGYEEAGGSLLHTGDYGYPSCPDGLLSRGHVDSTGRSGKECLPLPLNRHPRQEWGPFLTSKSVAPIVDPARGGQSGYDFSQR